MENLEPRPTDICEQVRGVHVDIVFNAPIDLDVYLGAVKGHRTLYRTANSELKYPINEARLDYYRNDYDEINLSADIVFDAEVANDRCKATWQYDLRDDMLAHLNEKGVVTHELRHQAYDFYVVLNTTYAAFVQFDTDTHTCCVSVSLVKLHELYFALDNEASNPSNDTLEDPYRYDVLKEFSNIWSLVIDTTIERFGKETLDNSNPKSQIVIEAPTGMSTEQEGYETFYPDNEPTFFIPGITIPEAEIDVSNSQGFELIGGLTHAKERLEDIKATFRDPDGAAMYGISGRHFILHGPAGTGKTSLVHALAKEIDAEIKVVDSSSIVSKWVGNSAKNTRTLFEAMKTVEGPLIVFFDEFDTLARKGTLGTSERTDVKKYLNAAIDDISKNHPNIIIAAATNADIDDLEESLMRSGRLEPIGAPAPNEEERVDVWSAVIHKSFLDFSATNEIEFTNDGFEIFSSFVPYENDVDPVALARGTDGMTGADFEVILERARRNCYRIYRSTGEVTKVSQADLLREIHQLGR